MTIPSKDEYDFMKTLLMSGTTSMVTITTLPRQ